VQESLLKDRLLKQFAAAPIKLEDFNESLVIIDVLYTPVNDLLGVWHLAKFHHSPSILVLFKFEIIEHLIWITLARTQLSVQIVSLFAIFHKLFDRVSQETVRKPELHLKVDKVLDKGGEFEVD